MRVVLLSPFAAATTLWQAQGGGWTVTACVRATYRLAPGREARLAGEQQPVDEGPGGIAPYKPRVDVILVGSAFAPGGKPVEALVARLAVGELDKSVGVVGDRVWVDGPEGMEPSAPRPFSKMPLDEARAPREGENPGGFDLTRAPEAGALALPNLEPVEDDPRVDRAARFGPVAATSAARKARLAADALAWAAGERKGPAPASLDFRYFNAAPRDQQLDALASDGTLVLENLSPGLARLHVHLPRARPKAFVASAGGAGAEVPMRLDTLFIDTDRALFTLTHRGAITVAGPEVAAASELLVALEDEGESLDFAAIQRLRRSSAPDSENDVHSTKRILLPRDPGEGPTRDQAIGALLTRPQRRSGSWDEITVSELSDAFLVEEPATASRIDLVRVLDEPSSLDEPLTNPLLSVTPRRVELRAADYARIAAAAEAGTAASVLFDYGLGLQELPGLTRAWTERAGADPAFAADFARELEASRLRARQG